MLEGAAWFPIQQRTCARSGGLLDLGVWYDIVSKAGTHYSYGPDKLGQGRDQAKAFLDEHPGTALEIEEDIYVANGMGGDLVTPIEHDAGEHS
jgi:recombination protein RecA